MVGLSTSLGTGQFTLGHVKVQPLYGADPAQEDQCKLFPEFGALLTEFLRELCHSEPSAAYFTCDLNKLHLKTQEFLRFVLGLLTKESG